MTKHILALLTLLLLATSPAAAQEHAHAPTSAATAHAAHDSQPHPAVSQDGSWAGAMVIIVLGLFLAAAVIGPVVRANMPAEAPVDHSHDDDHGAGDHHDAGHGHGGGHGH